MKISYWSEHTKSTDSTACQGLVHHLSTGWETCKISSYSWQRDQAWPQVSHLQSYLENLQDWPNRKNGNSYRTAALTVQEGINTNVGSCYKIFVDVSCLHASLCRQASTKLWISPCSQLLPYRVQVKTFFCFFLHIPLESFLDEVLYQFSIGVGQARHSLLQLSQDCQVFALHLAVSCLQAGTLMGKQEGKSSLSGSPSCIATTLYWPGLHIK